MISPDGRWLYVSSDDGHLYRLPAGGGEAQRVSAPQGGCSGIICTASRPDGGTLAFVAVEEKAGRTRPIFT